MVRLDEGHGWNTDAVYLRPHLLLMIHPINKESPSDGKTDVLADAETIPLDDGKRTRDERSLITQKGHAWPKYPTYRRSLPSV